MNGAYGYVQIGQQMLWKREIIFPAFYDLLTCNFSRDPTGLLHFLRKINDFPDATTPDPTKTPILRHRLIHRSVFCNIFRAYFQADLFGPRPRLDLAAPPLHFPVEVVPRIFEWNFPPRDISTCIRFLPSKSSGNN